VGFLRIFFIFDCFESASQIANGERSRRSAESGLVNKLRQLKTHGKCTEKIATRERSVVRTIALPTSALRKRSRCYWKTRSNVKGQHAPTRNNQRQKYLEKNTQKVHLLLRILAVVGRYGPHLIIVMTFVTQNNLKRFSNFRPSAWILPPGVSDHLSQSRYYYRVKLHPAPVQATDRQAKLKLRLFYKGSFSTETEVLNRPISLTSQLKNGVRSVSVSVSSSSIFSRYRLSRGDLDSECGQNKVKALYIYI